MGTRTRLCTQVSGPILVYVLKIGPIMMTHTVYQLQRVLVLSAFWLTWIIHVSGTVGCPPTNAKIPHFHVHKAKTAVVGSTVVKTAQEGDPL